MDTENKLDGTMRDYGKVHSTFWTSETIRSMSEDGRSLALYLLTCQHGTIAGVFRAPDGYVCEDIQWDAERVSKGFAELLAKGFANRCATTKWVWIDKHLEWNPPENPNQVKAAAKMALQVPDSCEWKASFIGKHGVYLGLVALKPEPLPNPSETLPQPVTVTVTGTVVGDSSDLLAKSQPHPPEPPVVLIPLNDNAEFPIVQSMIDEWSLTYPAVNVVQELREMRTWSNANKSQRKTARGVNAFVVRWLGKEQDKGGKNNRDSPNVSSLFAGAR